MAKQNNEEVTIERHAVNRPAGPDDIDNLTNQVIHLPIYAEVAELQTNTVVREEVNTGENNAKDVRRS